jgi:hypothetical protein
MVKRRHRCEICGTDYNSRGKAMDCWKLDRMVLPFMR